MIALALVVALLAIVRSLGLAADLRRLSAEIDQAYLAGAAAAAARRQLVLRLVTRCGVLVRRAADLEADRDAAARRAADLEELRCHDIGAFHDGELSADRAAAFRDHLAGCGACAAELHNLIQAEIAVGPKRKR